MLVSPLNRTAFLHRVVQPTRCHRAPSRDGGDQGVLNSLVHGLGAMGPDVRVLPSVYNGVQRVASLRPRTWARWDPALVHFVGHPKPWSEEARAQAREPGTGFPREREWQRMCGG